MGWIFNDQYLDYEQEISRWSGVKRIASIPFSHNTDKQFIKEQAAIMRDELYQILNH
jgi:dethiobiotin synthetase